MSFSVSMCVYGGDNPEHFDIAVGSIAEQTVKPDELVLTVDGPIPSETEAVIKKYCGIMQEKGIRFRVLRLKKNMGHGIARRVGIKKCSHDIIAIMDADDIAVPTRFEKQIAYLTAHPEVAIVGGCITEFINDESDARNVQHIAGRRIVPSTDEEIKRYMQKRCPMNQMTVVFRKKDILEVGGYRDWFCNEDYFLWIRLAAAGKIFGNIDESLVLVRVGKEMYERRGGWKYFKSEAKLQTLMHRKGMTSFGRYAVNVGERFVLQVMMPNRIRGIIFQKFAREREA